MMKLFSSILLIISWASGSISMIGEYFPKSCLRVLVFISPHKIFEYIKDFSDVCKVFLPFITILSFVVYALTNWKNLKNLFSGKFDTVGPQGEKGKQGEKGEPGKDA